MENIRAMEARVHDLVDAVLSGGRIEDALIECKAEWMSGHKAARRIAGHCNAARGEEVLWIVGLDEDGHRVLGTGEMDIAVWWDEVRSRFDQEAPEVEELRVNTVGGKVVALIFQTTRAPFVVKNPDGGPIQREVPWREGTSTRSAHRGDLLRILVPATSAPKVDAIYVEVTAAYGRDDDIVWMLNGEVFVEGNGQQVALPKHRLSASMVLPGKGIPLQGVRIYFDDLRFRDVDTPGITEFFTPPAGVTSPQHRTAPPPFGVFERAGDAFVVGAGRVTIRGESAPVGLPSTRDLDDLSVIEAQVRMESSTGQRVSFEATLIKQDDLRGTLGRWAGPPGPKWRTWS